MRGISTAIKPDTLIDRITPARAGNIDGNSISVDGRKDHPRSCGEYFFTFFIFRLFQGSPPLVRGISDNVALIYFIVGITPARAGNILYTYFCLRNI